MIRALSASTGAVDPFATTKGPADTSKTRKQKAADSVEMSATHDVFGAVENFFNMGNPGHLSAADKLSPAEKQQFTKIVATLLTKGYTGYEELVVNNKVEHHDIDMQIGDDRLRKARLYQDPKRRK